MSRAGIVAKKKKTPHELLSEPSSNKLGICRNHYGIRMRWELGGSGVITSSKILRALLVCSMVGIRTNLSHVFQDA